MIIFRKVLRFGPLVFATISHDVLEQGTWQSHCGSVDTVILTAMELGLHPGDPPLLLFKVHTPDAASFDVGEGNGSRFRAHNLWRMQWGLW